MDTPRSPQRPQDRTGVGRTGRRTEQDGDRITIGPGDTIDRAEFAEFLRTTRERRRITLDQISDETKIAPRHLAALERGDVRAWPQGMYRRAMMRAYAESIGLDKELALEQFNRAFEQRQSDQETPAPDPVAPPSSSDVSEARPRVQPPRATHSRVSQRKSSPWSMPKVSLPKLALPKLTLPRLTAPRLTAPRLTVPKLALPKLTVPKLTLPRIALPATALPRIDWNRLAQVPLPSTLPITSRGVVSVLSAAALAAVTIALWPSSNVPRDSEQVIAAEASRPAAPQLTNVANTAPSNAAQTAVPTPEPAVPLASEGQLVVVSEPAGARVTVNGVGWGETPITIRYLPLGEKRVRLTLQGYISGERTVLLAPDRPNARVQLNLRPREQPAADRN